MLDQMYGNQCKDQSSVSKRLSMKSARASFPVDAKYLRRGNEESNRLPSVVEARNKHIDVENLEGKKIVKVIQCVQWSTCSSSCDRKKVVNNAGSYIVQFLCFSLFLYLCLCNDISLIRVPLIHCLQPKRSCPNIQKVPQFFHHIAMKSYRKLKFVKGEILLVPTSTSKIEVRREVHDTHDSIKIMFFCVVKMVSINVNFCINRRLWCEVT